tara:strand:- start:36293 stop:36829 length:537 start_codon:yes stop_codon:yes gene_type:complete
MKFNRFSILLFLPFIVVFFSFGLPKNIEKKVRKEIGKTFQIESFSLNPIEVLPEVNSKMTSKIAKESFFKILNGDKIVGYAYIDKAPSKTDLFDYLILLTPDLIVAKTKVLIYREDYGGEIGSKRWLKQFIGLKSNNQVLHGKDIIPISGATISTISMTRAVNAFLLSLQVLIDNKVL